MQVIVKEVEHWGTYALIHAYTDEGIQNAINAGVRSIEHGLFASEETMKLMKEKDVSFSTQFLSYSVTPEYAGFTGETAKKFLEAKAGAEAGYTRAKKLGIKQEKKVPSVPTVFQRSCSWLYSKAPTEAQPVLRRLITLIFAGWLPHDLASSRSCLGLSSGVRPKKGLSNRVLEGSPGRGCAPGAALEGLCF